MTPPDDLMTLERDLDAVDRALATGAAEHAVPDARELQELALALHADAPAPDADFEAELAELVAAGFPRAGRDRRAAPAIPRAWRLPAAAAVALPLLVVAVVALTGGDGSAPQGDSALVARGGNAGGGGAGAERIRPPAAATPAVDGSASSALATPRPLAVGPLSPTRRARKIERSVSMTLEAPAKRLAEVADGVTRVTDRLGGFVERSDLATGEGGARGSFELRVPSARLREALRQLSGLATVRSQSQSGQDVTRQHVTTRDRLAAARAEQRSLLRRLAAATTDREAEAIRRRLGLVGSEISGLRGRLRVLHLRTDYTAVSVDLRAARAHSDGGGSSTLGDAFGDAGGLLVGALGIAIRVLALGMPLGLLALAGWYAGRALRRRRRESALA